MRFCQDVRPDERRKRLRRNEFHTAPETIFKKFGKRKKTIERLGTRRKLHQEVDVAVRPGFATQDGAKQGEPGDTKGTDFRFGSRQKFRRLLSGKRTAHSLNLTLLLS